jgi:MCP family monocarboxylic acid transporter-like MFS transporter 12
MAHKRIHSKNKVRIEFEQETIYKWLIVLGSFIVYFIADGVSLSFGIFTREFINYFNKTDSQALVFLTPALIQALPLFLSPFVCYLIEKYSCRPIAFVGSTLIVLSFILTRFLVDDIISLNLIMGFMTSCGLAMVYIPAYLIISFYFDKTRALATGIAVSGSGLGLFVLSPLSEYLINLYEWRDTCFLFGAISSHLFISACLFRSIKKRSSNGSSSDELQAASSNENKLSKLNKFKHEFSKIYSTRTFLIINLSYFILAFAIITPYNFLPIHIESNNLIDPSSLSISLIGISTLIGQIIIGIISDRFRSFNWLIYAVCIILAGLATSFIPFLRDIKLIYVYSVVFGFTTSVNYVLQSSLVIEALGLANLTLGFGCLQLSQGFSTLSGTVLLGWLKDNMNNYDMVFHISGAIIILSGLILILWPLTKEKKLKRQNTNLNVIGNEL